MGKQSYIIILLIISSISLFGQATMPDEQLVTYSAEDKSLKDILVELTLKTKVNIAFQDEILPVDSIITINARNRPLGLVIDDLIEKTGAKYRIVGSQISIIKDVYAKSKDKLTISGYLKDAESGEPLINANVYLYDKSDGTVTNEYGFYSFTLPKGVQRVYFSYLGYQLGIEEFKLQRDTLVDIKLDPSYKLNEVLIIDKKTPEPSEVTGSINTITLDQIVSTISLMGEPDVIRMTQTLPGVTTGPDGVGGMSVRGGSVDQNLILLDGVPLYNPYHALGIFSVFNPSVVKSATLYKSGFPARYASRLSSILDVRTRDGNKERIDGDLSIGLLSARGTLEGPIKKGKSSFLFSFRRSFMDLWLRDFSMFVNSDDTEGYTDYKLYDLNGKVNFKLGKKARIFFSYYKGSDNFSSFRDTEIMQQDTIRNDLNANDGSWGNELAVTTLTSQLGKKAFLKLTGYYTKYNFGTFNLKRIQNQFDQSLNVAFDAGYYESSIQDIGVNLGFDILPNSKNTIRLGANIISHTFKPGFVYANQTDNIVSDSTVITSSILQSQLTNPSITGLEYQFYFEDQINIGKYSTLNLGIHQSLIFAEDANFFLPQPRAAFNYKRNKFNFKTSISFVAQYLHLITNSGLGLPIDVWLPSTSALKPQSGWVASFGMGSTRENGIEYGAEAYYKVMKDIIAFGSGVPVFISENTNWQNDLAKGTGEAYGIEFFLNKTAGKTNWNCNYTFGYAFRTFEELNNGEPFRHRYDRRHNLKLAFIQKINKSAEFSLLYNYGSATPISLPQEYAQVDFENLENLVVYRYSGINDQSFKDYHRMDIGFNFYTKYKWARQKLTLGVYNVLNYDNPVYIDIVLDSENPNSLVQRSNKLFTILPSMSYSLSF